LIHISLLLDRFSKEEDRNTNIKIIFDRVGDSLLSVIAEDKWEKRGNVDSVFEIKGGRRVCVNHGDACG
jgi:hypothetical protein